MVYLSKPARIIIQKQYTVLIKRSKPVWIDPATGNSIPATPGFEDEGIAFTPPDWTDAVLLIKAGTH